MTQSLPPEYAAYAPESNPSTPPPSRWKYGLIAVAAVLLVFGAIAMLLNETLFRIKKVSVIGNRYRTWEEVVSIAGINGGLSYFTLNESAVADKINGDRYLIFEGMEKNFPDSVTLYVRERQPMVGVQEMSATYLLAADGMVLERNNELAVYTNMIMVTGLKPKDLHVGRVVTSSNDAIMDAYLQLLEEISLQGFTDEVSELNLSDPDSLYLITRDGFTAHLGDLSDLRAKIGTVRAVVYKLREMGKTKGMIEATVPGEATYSPPSQ